MELNPVEGAHVYDVAPAPGNGVEPPGNIESGDGVTGAVSVDTTVSTTVWVSEHPPALVPVTV